MLKEPGTVDLMTEQQLEAADIYNMLIRAMALIGIYSEETIVVLRRLVKARNLSETERAILLGFIDNTIALED